jgi:hypothetical protein
VPSFRPTANAQIVFPFVDERATLLADRAVAVVRPSTTERMISSEPSGRDHRRELIVVLNLISATLTVSFSLTIGTAGLKQGGNVLRTLYRPALPRAA